MRTTFSFLLAAGLFLCHATTHAQRVNPGNTQVLAGLGLGQTATALQDGQNTTVPWSFQVRHYLGKRFSLGLAYSYISYRSKPYAFSDGVVQQLERSSHQVLLRGAAHMDRLPKFDLYGGLQLGVDISSSKANEGSFDYFEYHLGLQPRQTKMLYSAFLGASYDLPYGFNVFSELSFGSTLLQAGIGYRF